MKVAQANTTASMPENAFFSSSGIRPMLMQPRFMKESDVLLHVPFLFWLMNAVRPAKTAVIGAGNGVAYLAICQAIEEFLIPGRCTGILFGDHSENSDAPKPALRKFENHAGLRYEGMADLHEYETLDKALSDIQPGSLNLLFVDCCELAKEEISNPTDWMKKLAHGGCMVVHGWDESNKSAGSLKKKIEPFSASVMLDLDFGAGLTVVLKEDTITDLAKEFIAFGGNGCHCKADDLLLRRLGQGLAAMARNEGVARQRDDIHGKYVMAQERQNKLENDMAVLSEAYEARNRKIWELQAINFDRESEKKDHQKHQEILSDAVSSLKLALETIQKEKDSISESLSEKLRLEKESHYRETGILTKMLEERKNTGQAEVMKLRRQVQRLSEHNTALLSSTSWRITAPIRKIKTMLSGK